MGQLELKKKYGWSEEMEKFFISSNFILSSEWKGSFRIKKHSNRLFWYYQLSSRIKGRDKYLCSVIFNENDSESFSNCCKKLIERVNSGFIISSNNKKFIHPYIDLYITYLNNELHSQGGRRTNTTTRLMSNIKDFKRYCERESVRLNVIPQKECRTVFLEYLTDLMTRDKNGTRGGLSRGTIKSYLQGVRYFLDWVCLEKQLNGLSLFPSHPITNEYQNKLLLLHMGKIIPKDDIVRFKNEFYEECYQTCNNKVRDLWKRFCASDGQISGLVDKNGKICSPPIITGSDFIYFIGLLQLRGGFRIGEVLYSYRNVSIYNEHHLKKHSKEMGSYWSFNDDEGWLLNIKNSKGKNRVVPIGDTIRCWSHPPPQGVKYSHFKNDKGEDVYDTKLLDVIFSMFPDSYYLFPSPKYIDNPDSPRSKTHTMNIFRETLVNRERWDRFGIRSSHNLRSFFVSYMMRREDISPLQVCEITGHSLNVMEKYYLRENLQSKFTTFNKVNQRGLLTSKHAD